MTRTRVTDSELAAIIRAEIAGADGHSELSIERSQNMDYYQCRPFGNEMEGRSSVVSSDVRGQVNNSARQNMADLRAAFNDLIWFQYGVGDKAVAAAYASATSFTLAGADVTSVWHAGRRVKAVGSSTGTIYGTIASAAYASSITTVNVHWDSGSLANESLTLYLSQIPVTGRPAPSGPYLHVVRTTAQGSISGTFGSPTVIAYDQTNADTCNGWDATNKRWTPNVAGDYEVTANALFAGDSGGGIFQNVIFFRKNGSSQWGNVHMGGGMAQTGQNFGNCNGTCVISMNGTTDYIDIAAYSNLGNPVVNLGAGYAANLIIKRVP